MSYWTAPQFFRGEIEQGSCRCAYCGGRCDDSAPASKFVLPSFTARDSLSGGTHVCFGCRLAMDERADVTLIDGESRAAQKTRLYSWFVPRPGERIAATKTHREQLAAIVLDPPEPPFLLSIALSGQRHVLYRSRVALDRREYPINLEGEPIYVTRQAIADRLDLCRRLVACLGKPALDGELDFGRMLALGQPDAIEDAERWNAVRDEPLSRLALFICPKKEDCR